ncbi:hypothetical protein H4R20_000239 [Coemansia guatemalensis]|uniref:Transcription regulator Rua1 C-terminal domain-containing protein n=1 Tax=Coemansia guatemalensis TaxID=2761395 RepID=A0A9W8I1R6_9FUNG|nr:hypothetical protein H4R20_000239 [Coemansia guatemalensis]
MTAADPIIERQLLTRPDLRTAYPTEEKVLTRDTEMSSGTIPCTNNAGTADAGQTIKDLAFAAATSSLCGGDSGGGGAIDATSISPASMSDDTSSSSAFNVEAHPSAHASPAPSAATNDNSNGGSDQTQSFQKGNASTPDSNPPSLDQISASVSASDLEPSLLLKPEAAALTMATPQSMQDRSTPLLPLEMLIAALEPQNQDSQQQQLQNQEQMATTIDMETSAMAMANVQQLTASHFPDSGEDATSGSALPQSFWDTSLNTPGSDASNAGFPGMSWDASRRASDAVLLNSYHAGEQSNPRSHLVGTPQFQIEGQAERKGSYPPGLKRPFSNFEHLLTAADMYTTDSPDSNTFSQMPATDSPRLAKHARHASIVGEPNEIATAVAAAAAATASLPYTAAFPCSAKLADGVGGTEQLDTGGIQAPYLNTCFEQLNPVPGSGPSLGSGMPMLPGAPMSQAQLAQSLSMSAHPQQMTCFPQHARSLSLSHIDHSGSMMSPGVSAPLNMASPMTAAAGQHPVPGYFYDGFSRNGSGPGIPEGLFPPSQPIPAISGVTVSPKIKPWRISVPDVAAAADETIPSNMRPRRQKIRFSDDLYTPMWVRGSGHQKEGFCDTCTPGKWLQLKNSAFWYHKQFSHGISSVSGRPFTRPLQVRHYDADIIEGLCHQCRQWVPIANAKRRNSVLWFRHAHKCHVYHKPKHDGEYGDLPITDPIASMAYIDIK